MSINGIGTAGYPLTGYTARKTGRSAESGAVGFMETVEEKAAQGKAADQDEKAFEMVGPNAPQEVKDAWMEAAKEVNANGMGIRGNGMMSHISQMMPQLGHFSDTIIQPEPVSPMSQARFLHHLSRHFIFRIIPPPLPQNTSVAISPH